MRTVDKIDSYLDKMEEKKNKKRLPFLHYVKEDLVDILDESTVESLEEKRKVGGPEYDKHFTKMLKKWKIKSYKDLKSKKDQQDFFDDVEKQWNK